MSNSMRAVGLIVGLGLGQAACSGDPVDIGDNEISRSSLASYVATWEGYIENFNSELFSDQITLTVVGEDEGTIRFGDGSVRIEPPTDPNILRSLDGTQAPLDIDFSRIVENYEYLLERANLEDERLRVAFDVVSVYSLWCEKQTPVRQAEPRRPGLPEYSCSPENNVSAVSDDVNCTLESSGEVVDCGRWRACWHLCSCDMERCWVGHSEMRTLDAALEDNGQKLVGSYGGHTIRLKRVP